ncbi:MAG: hypothetical protein ACJ8GJ_17105 [Vitreoscilla sp.]
MIKGQHEHCQQRLAGLRELLTPVSAFDLNQFIAVWANYEFDLYATRDGRQYLMLMLKLSADEEVDAELRRHLNCSEVLVVQAFARERPSLDAQALRGGWFMASGALYAAIVSAEETQEPDDPASATLSRVRAISFLIEGLRGYWSAGVAPLAAMSD